MPNEIRAIAEDGKAAIKQGMDRIELHRGIQL